MWSLPKQIGVLFIEDERVLQALVKIRRSKNKSKSKKQRKQRKRIIKEV